MKPHNLFNTDDRAVSPVIGVILMVAITVILAAVIGTFVLGLGDSLGDSQPSAQISADINYSSGDSNATVNLEHSGGDPIDSSDMRVIASTNSNEANSSGEFAERFSVGDTESGEFAVSSDSGNSTDVRVRVIHTPSDSILVDQTIAVEDISGIDDGDITF